MIVCLGTTPTVQRTMVFPALRMDAVNRAVRVMETASGKSINAARVAHTLGEAVIATGFLGGRSGQWIRETLTAAEIEHDFVEVSPATRCCVTIVEEQRGVSTELVEESAAVEADAHERLLETLRRRLAGRSVLVLSGSLTPGAPQDFYARCTAIANELGAQTLIDGRGEPLEAALAHRPAIVKPNAGELAATLGQTLATEADIIAGARQLMERGAQAVVVTRGPKPMIAVAGEAAWRVQGPAVRGTYPIGSGDSLAAGLAVAMARKAPLADGLALAMACGIANALIPLPGHLNVADVQSLRQQVRVERID